MEKTIKKTLSLLLCVCSLVSVVSLATIPASANYGDELHRPAVTDIVPADVETNTFYFYMPEAWRNEYNDAYDGVSLDSCKAGIYWWEGTGSCENADNQNGTGRSWPGHIIPDTDPTDSNIFVVKVPKDVVTIMFNNAVDGGSDPEAPIYYKDIQTTNVPCEFYDPNEDGYDFYPNGTRELVGTSFNNMIYVCNPEAIEINPYSGKEFYKGVWFFYYGDGTYSYYPTKEEAEANNAVYKDGTFPAHSSEEDDPDVSENGGDFSYTVLDDDRIEIIGYSGSEKDIVIPDTINGYTVSGIGDSAFEDCESLEEIKIPDSVTSIGSWAFSYCERLTSIIIPDPVTIIKDWAFYACHSLMSVTIGNSVTNIGEWAFSNCENLTNITIPNSITRVGGAAFYNTAWYDNLPDGVVYIGKVAYEYKGNDTCPKVLTLKEDTVSITDWAFSHCGNLTNITIPQSVTSIGEYAFYYCSNLTSITIPNRVTSIGEGTFEECAKLTSITIPNSVTSIEDWALGYYHNNDDWEEYKKIDNLTIKGYSGTEAERYAKDNGFEFVNLDDVPTTTGPSETTPTTKPTEPAKTTVTVKNAPKTLYVKEKAKINATVENGKGATAYKSSDKKVAKISSKGKITAIKKGTATITVTNNGVSKSFKITVKNPKLNKTKKSLKKGAKFTLKITGGVGTPKFTSNKPKVAKVNSKGKITAKKNGNATITVKTNGMKLKCTINVK